MTTECLKRRKPLVTGLALIYQIAVFLHYSHNSPAVDFLPPPTVTGDNLSSINHTPRPLHLPRTLSEENQTIRHILIFYAGGVVSRGRCRRRCCGGPRRGKLMDSLPLSPLPFHHHTQRLSILTCSFLNTSCCFRRRDAVLTGSCSLFH
ncbi:hypothetical protein ZOSMA_221G00310 [Zostera marina]|uniref:Uncharacterized protein n=1 Tax=Zostera marina TaxID=29655 RepID=A0A0K9PLN4_ZOSMR|nr:hypothetical protein ZOSMA_221G00310 [Zostera marina]